MKRTLAFLTGIMLLLPLFAAAQAGPGFRHERVLSELKLTPEQESQFQKIHYDARKKNIDLRAKLATARLELRQLLDNDTQDRAAVEKKFTEISAIQTSLKVSAYNAWADCAKVLTKEQQKTWKHSMPMGSGMQGMRNRPMRMKMMQRSMMDEDAPVSSGRGPMCPDCPLR